MHGDSSLLEGICIVCGSFAIKGARGVVSLRERNISEEIEKEVRVMSM